MKEYEIHKLIAGARVHPKLTDKVLVAIPDSFLKLARFKVKYEGEYMEIDTTTTKPLFQKEFQDKFGRNKVYFLNYYEWQAGSTLSTSQQSLL